MTQQQPTPAAVRRRRLGRAVLAIVAVATLAACANAVAPTPPVVAGGTGTLSRPDDWGFGMRTRTPGFTFDRGFGGSGA
ncbi:MAG: hypothetical protein K2X74_04565 [Acetobacteraceae bacterium]|nr:hypothetical protein [Acetobacteraceae bacterium]